MDYHKLNLVTKKMTYYMPTLEEITDQVGQSSVINEMDLTKGFLQIPIAKEDWAKTAFVCPMGKFQYRCMPFGLTNVTACLQQMIELALAGCKDCARTYIDDVIIYSEDWMNHLGHIDNLQSLKEAGLTVNPVKCEWGGKQIYIWGMW